MKIERSRRNKGEGEEKEADNIIRKIESLA